MARRLLAERIEVGVGREFNAALRERLPGWRLCEPIAASSRRPRRCR
jgi:hypothetical protein